MPKNTETHTGSDNRGTLYKHEGKKRSRYREYAQSRRRYGSCPAAEAEPPEEAKQKASE